MVIPYGLCDRNLIHPSILASSFEPQYLCLGIRLARTSSLGALTARGCFDRSLRLRLKSVCCARSVSRLKLREILYPRFWRILATYYLREWLNSRPFARSHFLNPPTDPL